MVFTGANVREPPERQVRQTTSQLVDYFCPVGIGGGAFRFIGMALCVDAVAGWNVIRRSAANHARRQLRASEAGDVANRLSAVSEVGGRRHQEWLRRRHVGNTRPGRSSACGASAGDTARQQQSTGAVGRVKATCSPSHAVREADGTSRHRRFTPTARLINGCRRS